MALGWWTPGSNAAAFAPSALIAIAARVRERALVVRDPSSGAIGLAEGGRVDLASPGPFELIAALPPLYPEWLGDRSFQEQHGVRFPYVTGSMANGIASARLVIAAARAGLLGFFGAAGLSRDAVERGLDEIARGLGDGPVPGAWGANLIHSPNEPELEDAVADLYVARGVVRVEASAYMALTPALVRYAVSGLHVGPDGRVARRHHVFAKISRPEVAERFMSPAPGPMLAALVASGRIREEEARLAAHVPLAAYVTVEADSGGHTDNRPLVALFPVILAERDALVRKHGFAERIRVGAAGGLGTPSSVAAAFGLGAAYVLTGSVNQAAVESGLSDDGREMLARADVADVAMAAAADMFELGVKLQVLKRGTLFAPRANKLHDAYRAYESLEAIPAAAREELEKKVLGASLDQIWRETESFWSARGPGQLERARRDPKHRMALVFRWYLGKSSRWAIAGETSRRADYQIWCGPAMGAFNTWVKGSFLDDPAQRGVAQIALNLLEGAAVITRAQQLRSYGVALPPESFRFEPRPLR